MEFCKLNLITINNVLYHCVYFTPFILKGDSGPEENNIFHGLLCGKKSYLKQIY